MIKGNYFKIVIPASGITDIKLALVDITGQETPLSPILADGMITASVDGDLKCGKHGVLLSGLRDGHKFRRYKSEGIDITAEGESSDTLEIKML